MGLIKLIVKVVLFLVVGVVAATAVSLFRQSRVPSPITLDEWADVPRNLP
jgi:hypothetical protein